MHRIFIGWDSREALAYDVCAHSIVSNTTEACSVSPLRLRALRAMGLYRRDPDPLAATEFSLTRFLVPKLAGYQGWALFTDCDILFRAPIEELFALADPDKAVMVVKHDHQPKALTKMGGLRQTVYPRKNWSSVVLWNCGHPANSILIPDTVNGAAPSFLHRFEWLRDDEIGTLPLGWNYLVGWNTVAQCPEPKAVHFTEGIPGIHVGHLDDEYAKEWLQTVAQLSLRAS